MRDRPQLEAVKEMTAPSPLCLCNRCGAVPTEVQTLLDSRKGKSVRIMRCKCGEQSWSEDT
jgi:hypothetical protein